MGLIGKLFNAVKSAVRNVFGIGQPGYEARILSESTFTARDMARPPALILARHKLGRSWFCRSLSPRSRRKHWNRLTMDERSAARAAGWAK